MKLILNLIATIALFGCATDRIIKYSYISNNSNDPILTFGDRDGENILSYYRRNFKIKTNESNIELCSMFKATEGTTRFPSGKSVVVGVTNTMFEKDGVYNVTKTCSPKLLAFKPESNKHYSIELKQNKESCYFDVMEKIGNEYYPVTLAIEKNVCIY